MKIIKKMQSELRFFIFSQNNPGGTMEYDDEEGISVYVVVQEPSWSKANAKARYIGLDFTDKCPCCGYRWSEKWRDDGMTSEEIAGWFMEHVTSPWFRKRRSPEEPDAYVHFFDGTVEGFLYGQQGALRIREEDEPYTEMKALEE